MYLLLSRYVKPLDEVERHLPAHREFLERHYSSGLFIVSGPLEPRTGGVIVTGDIDRNRILEILQEDPFYREGVSEYDIIEFRVTKSADWFKPPNR